MLRPACFLLGVVPPVVMFAGCNTGPSLVKAKGQLMYKGQPYKRGNNGVTVVFHPVDKADKTYPADPPSPDDGTFAFPGTGIPEGKYKVSIVHMAMTPSADT